MGNEQRDFPCSTLGLNGVKGHLRAKRHSGEEGRGSSTVRAAKRACSPATLTLEHGTCMYKAYPFSLQEGYISL